MMHARLTAAMLLVAFLSLIQAAAAETASEALNRIVEEYYEEQLVLNPVMATFNGDHRYNDRFTVGISPQHREQSLAVEKKYLQAIETVDPNALVGQDRLTWEIFQRGRKDEIEGFKYPDHLIPVNQFFSVPNFAALMGSGNSAQPFKTVQDYDNWLKRVDGFALWVDQAIVNMKEGVAKGVVQPRPIMEKVLPQLTAHVVTDSSMSMFYMPIANMPAEFPAADRDRLAKAYGAAIRKTVVPAYKKLHDYIRDEYMPKTRQTIGLSALPNGEAWYAYNVAQSTSSTLSAKRIHEIGQQEVARISAEMDRVKAQIDAGTTQWPVALTGNLGYDSADAMLEAYRQLRDRVHTAVPKLFHEFPKADYEIRAVEEFRQQSMAGAHYMPASPDGSRPGVFYVNTVGWDKKTRQNNETLFIHEAVPGHHFQISIQRELEQLPSFRRFGGYTAYSEGWGLYTETIGKELGMYQDPYMYLGSLESELFRAKRLVTDTGIHAMGWTREQAIEYLGGNVAEAERYIVIPGQALAYKIGQLKISELRKRAEERLGARFDVRDFHTEILKDGALPLDVLEVKVDRWLEGGASAAR